MAVMRWILVDREIDDSAPEREGRDREGGGGGKRKVLMKRQNLKLDEKEKT